MTDLIGLIRAWLRPRKQAKPPKVHDLREVPTAWAPNHTLSAAHPDVRAGDTLRVYGGVYRVERVTYSGDRFFAVVAYLG